MRSFTLALVVCAVAVANAAAQPRPKQLKDQTEHDLYNQALQTAADPAKGIPVLDNWTRRYPDSDYKDDRLYLYMQAYSKLSPPDSAKVVQIGGQLMSRSLHAVFTGPGAGLVIMNVLFLVAWNAAGLPQPAAQELTLGQKAARDLLAFIAGNKPDNVTADQWAVARADIEKRTAAALVTMALAPGNQAMSKTPPDCPAAEAAFAKALAEYPEDAAVSYNLGRALSCQGQHAKAIYQFVRAAGIDPALGGGAAYAADLYTKYPGSDEGLSELKALAKTGPHSPESFTIETSAEVQTRKQTEFARNHPQFALWRGIKEQLTAPNGAQYFEGQLKNAAIAGTSNGRGLKATILEGRPHCRPKELLVMVPPATRPEILIRLDTPIPGAAVPGEIEFDAIPRSFVAEPFLLTVDAVRTKIMNLKSSPCESNAKE